MFHCFLAFPQLQIIYRNHKFFKKRLVKLDLLYEKLGQTCTFLRRSNLYCNDLNCNDWSNNFVATWLCSKGISATAPSRVYDNQLADSHGSHSLVLLGLYFTGVMADFFCILLLQPLSTTSHS